MKVTKNIRDNLIAGIFVLAPFGAVFWVLTWIFTRFWSLKNLIPESLQPRELLGVSNTFLLHGLDLALAVTLLSLILVLIAITGMISRNYFGKRLLESFGHFVSRVPVLRTVYTTLQQLLDTFGAGHGRTFNRVVQIEYPRNGIYTLAFVTGESESPKGEKLLRIFVPTTPNPTSGFYLLILAKDAIDQSMSVEDALKEVISMGMISPGKPQPARPRDK